MIFSYRPISLLNCETILLAKALATRLNQVIISLVHLNQTGFMPGKSTYINLCRLYTHIAVAGALAMGGVVASLDAEKAFDSVEWGYLWEILRRFGFGEKFIGWIQLLYDSPVARVRTGDQLSEPFPLHRGTRPDCPLSLGLFAPSLEPLANLLRASDEVQGIRVGPLEEKLSLYADDTLSYLANNGISLKTALCIIDSFGVYSGIRINWGKSILFSVGHDHTTETT